MKSRITMLLISALFVIALGGNVVSQNLKNANLTGFAAIDLPLEKGQDYKARWARIRIETTPGAYNTSMRFEYDIANQAATYMFIRKTDSVWGGSLNVTLGRFITPTAEFYPGPSGLKTIRWAHAFDCLDVYGLGLHGSYTYRKAEVHVTHTDDYVSASAKVGPLATFWQEFAGYGFLMEPGQLIRFVKPVVIATVNDVDKVQYSVRNYAQLTPHLWLNCIGDLGVVEAASVGFTYEYAPTSFAKIYVDFAEDSRPTVSAEVTRTF